MLPKLKHVGHCFVQIGDDHSCGWHAETPEQAAEIVNAINCHAELLAACKLGVALYEGYGLLAQPKEIDGEYASDWVNAARAAIEKAEGQQ